ncbi:hypothetical protein AVEN_164642-1, partial [Araneus ventricosus]
REHCLHRVSPHLTPWSVVPPEQSVYQTRGPKKSVSNIGTEAPPSKLERPKLVSVLLEKVSISPVARKGPALVERPTSRNRASQPDESECPVSRECPT